MSKWDTGKATWVLSLRAVTCSPGCRPGGRAAGAAERESVLLAQSVPVTCSQGTGPSRHAVRSAERRRAGTCRWARGPKCEAD